MTRSRVVIMALATIMTAGCIPGRATPTTAPAVPTVSAASPAVGAATPAQKPSPPPSPLPSPSPSPSPSPVALTRLRLAVPPPSLGTWQINVAERKGLFRDQGLAVERVQEEVEEVPDSINARAAEVGLVSTESFVRGVRAGQSLVLVGGAVNRAALTLMAARDVPDFAALKGKPIAVRDPRDTGSAILKRILRSKNVGEQDYRLIGFEDPGTRAAAAVNGTVAASLVEPGAAARMEASGFSVLARAIDVVPNYQSEALAVRMDWARQNEQLLIRFLRAVVDANRWMYAPANHREAIDILADTLKLSASEAGRVYDEHLDRRSAIPREAEIEQPGVRAVIELMAEIEALRPPLPDPSRLTDTGYLLKAR